jgi:hypothetical protein
MKGITEIVKAEWMQLDRELIFLRCFSERKRPPEMSPNGPYA